MMPALERAVGSSDIFLDFQERLEHLAQCDRPVLIIGERGTGKELAAQRLHYGSARWEKNMVTLLCPALSESLMESELFGHEAGAFTGARGRRAGYWERADKGTLFLDEIGDMPLPLQDKILRAIEYGVLERVGGSGEVRVDVRVVAATNRDLPRLAAEGRFREDLLDRLSFDVLHVPPLRRRGDDVLELATLFAVRMAQELGLDMNPRAKEGRRAAGLCMGNQDGENADAAENEFAVSVFGARALRQLYGYAWPGNVRELKNAVERTVLRNQSLFMEELILDAFLPPWDAEEPPSETSSPSSPLSGRRGGNGVSVSSPAHRLNSPRTDAVRWRDLFQDFCPDALPPGFSLSEAVEKMERAALAAALEQARYRQAGAAGLLGLTYHQFRALYRKYNEKSRPERG